ncbi:MAG: polyribonucleotide nucleotidyltransferase [Deltaproteobacteria bacterium HGW-Deltaproteobacteria-14]|jgi:polyribonucleotide nucleotidyltransferase|nr:MAG: polyribonucleotide nucleotidyltransferase [Deltaproteobacteria bacterium HGW-Deltaproteobacteria-14]
MKTTETITIGGAELTFETGELARQAHGAVLARHAGSAILATVVAGPDTGERRGFLPLTVEYRERMSAGGRVPGGYLRREARIGDHEILTSRLIDRTLRPLFPAGYDREVQVLVTCLGADAGSDLESLAILAGACALHISSLPFDGPVAGLRISSGAEDGAMRFLAPHKARARAAMDFILAADRRGLVMLEGGAAQVPAERVLAAIDEATAALTPVLDAFDRLRAAAGRDKAAFSPPVPQDPAALADRLLAVAGDDIDAAWQIADRQVRPDALERAFAAGRDALGHEAADDAAWRGAKKHLIRRRTSAGDRLGGRGLTTVRPLTAQVGYLQAAHGSALFTRGDTQALVTATLGTADDAREYETVLGKRSERFMLHYNFPPFAVGEVRPQRGPGRREIGHGALARRAIVPVLPKKDDLPWVLRVVSDILESNGSSSMATVCGTSLALFDAGVPLAAPVAGVAMGLVHDADDYVILTDITGDEDALGDMDFKVAGTRTGVTALQLDNKLGALPRAVLAAALEQARVALDEILDVMDATLPAARESIAPHAPQVTQIAIPKRTIGRLIGPGGRKIQEIQSQTRTRIDVRDDGRVRVFAKNAADLAKGAERVRAETLVLEVGAVYDAQVVTIKEYGAFVRIGAHEGLVHISELDHERTDRVEDVVKVGDEVRVRVQGADDRGRLELSRRAALTVE